VAPLVPLNPFNIILKVSVGVRVAVCKEDGIVVIFKLVRECQGVVILGKLEIFADLVLEVADISAVSVPSCLFLFSYALGVNRHLHAIVKHGVGLVVVEDVELDGDACSRVLHFEVEPLGVPYRVRVVLHQKIVFLLADFGRQV